MWSMKIHLRLNDLHIIRQSQVIYFFLTDLNLTLRCKKYFFHELQMLSNTVSMALS